MGQILVMILQAGESDKQYPNCITNKRECTHCSIISMNPLKRNGKVLKAHAFSNVSAISNYLP